MTEKDHREGPQETARRITANSLYRIKGHRGGPQESARSKEDHSARTNSGGSGIPPFPLTPTEIFFAHLILSCVPPFPLPRLLTPTTLRPQTPELVSQPASLGYIKVYVYSGVKPSHATRRKSTSKCGSIARCSVLGRDGAGKFSPGSAMFEAEVYMRPCSY